MKKIVTALMLTLLLIGCSSKSEESKNVNPKLVVGQSLSTLTLKDQNEKQEKLSPDTKMIFFSFSKKVGHMCNGFLEKQDPSYLAEHNAVYVADVSPAPSLIKKMFILPDLRKLKFPILLINNDKLSAEYSKGMNKEDIVVVTLDNLKITNIQNLKDSAALESFFSKK